MISRVELAAASLHATNYSVGVVRVGNDGRGLFGSGTLIAAARSRSILTSADVLDLLSNSGRLGIALRTELNQISLDASGLIYRRLPVIHGQVDSRLGLIEFSEDAAQRFDERKRFVDVGAALAAETPLAAETQGRAFWCVNGFTAKMTTTDLPLDCFDMVCGYTNITALRTTPIDSSSELEKIIDLELDMVSEHVGPQGFAGLVGGTLWKMQFARDPSRTWIQEAVLSGVVDAVMDTTKGSVHVRCISARLAMEAIQA